MLLSRKCSRQKTSDLLQLHQIKRKGRKERCVFQGEKEGQSRKVCDFGEECQHDRRSKKKETEVKKSII